MFGDLIRRISGHGLCSSQGSQVFQAAKSVAETSAPSEWIRSQPIWTSDIWYEHPPSGLKLSRSYEGDFRAHVHWAQIKDHRFSMEEGRYLFDIVHKRSEVIRAEHRRQIHMFAADLPNIIDSRVVNVVKIFAPEAERVVRANFRLWPAMFCSNDTLLVVKGQCGQNTLIAYLDRHPLWRGSKECVVLGPNFQQDPERLTLSGQVAENIVDKLCAMV